MWDNYPVSEGHALIIPKRHIISLLNLNNQETLHMYQLLKETCSIINDKFHPDGYNIGINEGEAAGRTIHHVHMHIIPRYFGDVENPRGGIRHIIPGKGDY